MPESQRTGEGAGPGLPARPYLKPWYRIAHSNGRLILEYAHSTVVLEGKAADKLLPVLLPMLDGRTEVDRIIERLGEPVAPAVRQALQMLADHEVLSDGPPLDDSEPAPLTATAHFLASIEDRTPAESERLLADARVAVVGEGPTAQEIANLLRTAGISQLGLIDWADPAVAAAARDLAVAAPEPSELPRLEAWNLRALELGMPWLQVLPFDGRIVAVGPLYVPGDTCCFECYRRRRAANINFPAEDYWALERSPASYPLPPPLRGIAAGLASMLALRWLSDRAGSGQSSVPGRMYALSLGQTIGLDSHSVYRVPRCPLCFPDDLGAPMPWHG